jgi:DNA-binding beta-propeller fold protein YncE
MTIFSPDGRYGYVCSSFSPDTVIIDAITREVVGRVKQESPFCPDIAATPDGKQVWLTLKDVGRAMVFDARPPFAVLKTIDTGPITNHVNIVHIAAGQFAYVTIGGLNVVKVYRTDDFAQVKPSTYVTIFDQGVLQVMQAAVTGLAPKKPFVLALSDDAKGSSGLEPLAQFMTNPAGAAVVNAIGPIRQVTRADGTSSRRYLVILDGKPGETGSPVQTQLSR